MPWRRLVAAVLCGVVVSAALALFAFAWIADPLASVVRRILYALDVPITDYRYISLPRTAWTIGFALPGIAAAALILALRRPRDAETRCRKCGYILKGLPEPRCPECGEQI